MPEKVLRLPQRSRHAAAVGWGQRPARLQQHLTAGCAGGPQGDTRNSDALVSGCVLRVGEHVFRIELNTPTVSGLIVRQRPLVGLPVLPLVDTEFTAPPHAALRWKVSQHLAGAEDGGADAEPDGDAVVWADVPDGARRILVPRREDQGRLIAVEATPMRGEVGSAGHKAGPSFTYEVPAPVAPAPDMSAHRARWEHAAATRPDGAGSKPESVRVLSYNILADNYCNTYARARMQTPEQCTCGVSLKRPPPPPPPLVLSGHAASLTPY